MRTLYNDITAVIEKEMPEIKWVDFDMGQLDIQENPPVQFPCILLDFAYPQNQSIKKTDRMEIEINLKAGFYVIGQTNTAAPVLQRQDPMIYINVFERIIKRFSGFKTEDYAKFTLVSATPELLPTGVKIINITFTTKHNI